MLLSTHIVSDIEYIANEILLMKDGCIVQSGTLDELLFSMPERVWCCEVSRDEVADYLQRYKVANVKTIPQGAELRILSDECPSDMARRSEATLEDVFLYYFGEKAEEGEGE